MTLRIGMIGPGGMGRAHLDRIRTVISGGQIAGVSDIAPEPVSYTHLDVYKRQPMARAISSRAAPDVGSAANTVAMCATASSARPAATNSSARCMRNGTSHGAAATAAVKLAIT